MSNAPLDLDASFDDGETTSTLSLFEGDEGTLTQVQRRALVALIKHRYISSRTHPNEWKAVASDPRPLRARLHDLFLDLVVHPEQEVAYKRQVVGENSARFPTLLHDTSWGREETVVLVFLRVRYRSERAAGAERVFVDRADIHEYVQQHRPPSATDVAGDRQRTERAIQNVYRADMLLGRSDADRFEVSNAIEVLLPVPKLQDLLAWLRQQNGSDGDGTPDGPAEGPSDGPPDEPANASATGSEADAARQDHEGEGPQ